MVIIGSQVKYAKKQSDLKGKKAKNIELKGATITSDKESGGKFWIRIKGKDNRQIACKSKDSRDKWIDLLKAAGGSGAETKPKEKNEKPKEEAKKPEKPKEEAKKPEKPKEEAKKPEKPKDEEEKKKS